MDDLVGQAQLEPDLAHLVLEELAKRFHQLKFHPFGQSADVMVALDERSWIAGNRDALDHVRIEGALGQPFDLRTLLALLASVRSNGILEHPDEFRPDNLPLSLGIGDPFELRGETAWKRHVLELDMEVIAEDSLDDFRFIGAEQAVVDENAGQLVANGLV